MKRPDERTKGLLATLQRRAVIRDVELQLIRDDPRWSDDYRAQLIGEAKARHVADGKGEAADVWKAAQRRAERARQALEVAAAQYERRNYAEIDSRAARFRREMDRPLTMGETRAQRLAALAKVAQYSAESRAALAAVILSGDYSTDLGDADLPVYAHWQAQAKQWETDDAAPLTAAQQEAAEAEAALPVIRETALNLEAALTDTPRNPWNPLTTWGRDVFQDTPESLGLIVTRGNE